MLHELKLTQPYFDDVASGKKNFELRRNDRDFYPGDYLALNEYTDDGYTGRFLLAMITYVLGRCDGLRDDYCILGIAPCHLGGKDVFLKMGMQNRISEADHGGESDAS